MNWQPVKYFAYSQAYSISICFPVMSAFNFDGAYEQENTVSHLNGSSTSASPGTQEITMSICFYLRSIRFLQT